MGLKGSLGVAREFENISVAYLSVAHRLFKQISENPEINMTEWALLYLSLIKILRCRRIERGRFEDLWK